MSDSLSFHRRVLATSRSVFGTTAFQFLAGAALLSGTPAFAGFFSPGDVVVVRFGTGAAPLSSASTAVFLDEYTANGVYVQSITMPTAASGANQAFTNSGTSTSEGFVNWATDNMSLVLGGYATPPGTSGVTGSTSATIARVLARIDLNGAPDTTTALSDGFSGGNIRSVASDNGTQFWAAGSVGGSRYATFGATTSTQLNSVAPTNLRVIGIFGGQLYVSSASGTFQGVGTIGTGLPTTSGQTPTILPGFPTAAGPSNYDYFFADANTLYVADDRNSASGGIQKWTQSGGTWTLQYTLTPPGPLGCRGLTATVANGMVVLFATTTQTNANQIVRVVDTGAGSTFSTIVTGAANTVLRGIRLVPITCVAGPDCDGDGLANYCEVALGFDTDLNHNSIPDGCEQNGGTPYCFGDAGCPCSNNSASGSGQGCSHGSGGAALIGSGMTSVSADTLLLSLSNLPPPPGGLGSVLYFQGDVQTFVPFNDGVRCVGGNQVRLGTKGHTGTTSSFPQGGDPTISVRGGIPAAGGAYNYQAWYRAFPSVCGNHSNLSNGVSVVWKP